MAPANGFEGEEHRDSGRPATSLLHCVGARQEARRCSSSPRTWAIPSSLDETLSVLSVRLRRLIPYDAIAIYIPARRILVPEYVNGENFRLFSSLEYSAGPRALGLGGGKREVDLNGNPAVESGYLKDPSRSSALRSAMSVPLEGLQRRRGRARAVSL